jgi:hypothetical protein
MDIFIDLAKEQIMNINWDGPALFVLIILAILLILRKWSMFLLIVLTIVLGWGAEDLIITSMGTDQEIISVPFLIYCIGGGAIIILALISFFKSAV